MRNLADRIAVSRLAIGIAAGTVAGDSSFDRSDGAIAAHLRADVPNLATAVGRRADARSMVRRRLMPGSPGGKTARLSSADLSGSGIGVSGSAAERVEAHVSATPTGPLDNAATRIAVAAKGRIEGLALPEGGALTPRLGRGHRLVARRRPPTATRRTFDLTQFAAQGGGIDLTGSGRLATAGRTIAGHVDFAGSASGMRTGIAAADALLGNKAAFAGAVRRDEAGAVALDDVRADRRRRQALRQRAVRSRLGSAGRGADPRHAAAEAARPALGTEIAGTVSAQVKARGPLDRLQLQREIEGRGITAGGATIDRLQLTGEVADLSQRQAAIDGTFSCAAGSTAVWRWRQSRSGNSELAVRVCG